MLKVKQHYNSKLKKYAIEFEKNNFSTYGLIVYCTICDIKVSSEKNIQRHMKAISTKTNLQKLKILKKIQPVIHKNTIKSDFNYELCNALVAAKSL